MSERNKFDALPSVFGQARAVTAQPLLEPRDFDCVYRYACQLFDANEFASAKRYFQLLTRLSGGQFHYWLALGLTCQRRSEHEEALLCFGRAASVRRDDPRPAFHAGLSYRRMCKMERARAAFCAALKGCGERLEYAALKTEIQRQARLPLNKECQ